MSFRVSDGIGSGTPGRLTPLCEMTVPPTSTSQRARPRSTSSTRSRTAPSSMRTSKPGLKDGAEHRRRDRKVAVSGAVLAGRSSPRSPRTSSTGSVEVADAELRPLQVGDQRDRTADLLRGGADHVARSA